MTGIFIQGGDSNRTGRLIISLGFGTKTRASARPQSVHCAARPIIGPTCGIYPPPLANLHSLTAFRNLTSDE